MVYEDIDRIDEDPQWLNSLHLYFIGTAFFILVIILSWQGWRCVHKATSSGPQNKLVAKVSFKRIIVVTSVLFFLFTTRTIYDFVAASYPKIGYEVAGDATLDAFVTLVAFIFWEIIPTILVLMLFGRVKTTNLGAFAKKVPKLGKINSPRPKSSMATPTGQLLRAHLFSDPRRYDSDEENSPLLRNMALTPSSPNTGPLTSSLPTINSKLTP